MLYLRMYRSCCTSHVTRAEKKKLPNKSQLEDRQFPKNNVSKKIGCTLHEKRQASAFKRYTVQRYR